MKARITGDATRGPIADRVTVGGIDARSAARGGTPGRDAVVGHARVVVTGMKGCVACNAARQWGPAANRGAVGRISAGCTGSRATRGGHAVVGHARRRRSRATQVKARDAGRNTCPCGTAGHGAVGRCCTDSAAVTARSDAGAAVDYARVAATGVIPRCAVDTAR